MLPQSHTDLALWEFLGTHGSHFVGVFVAHTDLTDPTLSFDGGKSHGGFMVCGFGAHTNLTDLTDFF